MEREEESTTGMMDGFAIPHAKDASIKDADIVIVRLNGKVDWKSLDGEGTDFVIALFIPDSEAGTTHLNFISGSQTFDAQRCDRRSETSPVC